MLYTVKGILKTVPIVAPVVARIRAALGRSPDFTTSSDYWERRYRKSGNSGAGSYNRLAEFKAEFLNAFVENHQIDSVIEYGSGDGAQLRLAKYPRYVGVDVSSTAIEMCRAQFAGDTTKKFLLTDAVPGGILADLSLSLDVIYHLVEDKVFHAYMEQLFASAGRYVIVYSSNMDREWPVKWVRHRNFTRWVEQSAPEWRLDSVTANPYPYDPADPENTSFADFYVFAHGDVSRRMA